VVEFAARLSAVAAEVGAAQWRVAAEPAAPGAAAHGWFCEQVSDTVVVVLRCGLAAAAGAAWGGLLKDFGL